MPSYRLGFQGPRGLGTPEPLRVALARTAIVWTAQRVFVHVVRHL